MERLGLLGPCAADAVEPPLQVLLEDAAGARDGGGFIDDSRIPSRHELYQEVAAVHLRVQDGRDLRDLARAVRDDVFQHLHRGEDQEHIAGRD